MKYTMGWVYNGVKKNDMYGKDITLTFKGENRLRTFWGGFVSLLIMIALLINFCASMYTLINRNDSQFYTKTIFKDSFDDTKKKYIGKSTFRLGIAYKKFPSGEIDNDILTDPTLFNVSFFNTEYRRSTEGYERIPIPISYGYCNDAFLDFVEPELNERVSLDKHLCPTEDDYYLVGDFNSKIFRDIEILITPWNETNNEGVVWKSRDQIDLLIQTGYINIAITRSYFDFDDYENPIKTFLSKSDNHFMLLNATNWAEYLVQENTAMRSDNVFYSEPYNETTFYDIGTKNIKTVNNIVTGGAAAFITVGPDPKTIHYERTVYTLLDLFGYLGGLYDFMLFVGFWLVQGFQTKIFNNVLFSNLYQVKSSKENDEYNFNPNISVNEETKGNGQFQTINTRTSVRFRPNINKVLPNTFKNQNLMSSFESFEESHLKIKLDDLKEECNSRRLYSFKLHNICCPIFK